MVGLQTIPRGGFMHLASPSFGRPCTFQNFVLAWPKHLIKSVLGPALIAASLPWPDRPASAANAAWRQAV